MAVEAKYIGFKPRLWQQAVIDLLVPAWRARGQVITVKSRRQAGKSFMSENLLLWYSINKKRSVSALVSVTLAQSRKVFKELVQSIEKSNIIRKKNEQTLEIELINGSQIMFKSSEQGVNSLRGYTISGILILDEASFLSEDILQAVLPWTNVHQPPVLLVSTPKFKSCFFYRYWIKGLDENQPNYHSIDWNDYDISEFLSKEKLEEYRSMMPANQFKSEYLGEFLDDDAMVFAGFKRRIFNTIPDYSHCVAGVDWGAGGEGDNTAISILNENGEQIYTEAFNDKSTVQQIDRLEMILKKYNPILTLCEDNSIGTPLTDLLIERMPGYKIEKFTTTNKSKNDLVTHLQVAFEQEEITLLDDKQQELEIASYSLEFNPKTKSITYNAPQGLHDDRVMALMISWEAHRQSTTTGHYILG